MRDLILLGIRKERASKRGDEAYAEAEKVMSRRQLGQLHRAMYLQATETDYQDMYYSQF